MERYSEYKDSGVFWQTKMPKHWEVIKLRYAIKKLQRIQTPDSDLLICSNSGKVTKRGDNKLGLVAENDNIYQGVNQGDLLIHGMDTWHGAIAVSNYNGMCTPVVHVCDSDNDKAFIAYYLRNMATSKVFKLISNGVRQNTSDFRSWEKLAVIPIILPPLPEQHSIVSFLDSKCSKIDEWISKKQKEAELLGEAKQRIIADAVTRGLNPNVKMKKTGIAWLEEVPEHWNVVKLKAYCKENKEKNKGSIEKQVLSLSYGRVIVKKDINFGLIPDSYDNYQIVKPNYIILRLTDLQNDHRSLRTGLVKDKGIITSAYIGLIVNKIDSEYTHLLLHTYDILKIFYSMGGGLRQSMSYKDVANLLIPVPPLSEQQAIVTFINNKISKIDKLITSMTSEIDKLKEYKQRLISDVVTGQIKVN